MTVKNTGWLDLTTFSNSLQDSGGDQQWADPGNAALNDGARATIGVGTSDGNPVESISYYDMAVGLVNLNIPFPGVKIRGVEVRMEVEAVPTGGGSGSVKKLHLVQSNAVAGTDKGDSASYGANAYLVYGGPTDLWGLTLTHADVSSSSFGFAFSSGVNTVGIAGDSTTAYLDHMQMRIYYEQTAEMLMAM